MVVEEGTSAGGIIKFAVSFPNSKAEVVSGVEFENRTFDGSMRLASDGFRTYKRRKRSKSSSESELVEDGSLPVETGRRPMDRAAKEQREICSLDNSAEEVGLHRIDHHARLNGTDGSRHRDWRTVVLKHVFQSLDESEGGIRSCIRDVLLDKVDLGESVHHYDVRHTSPSQVSCQNASKGEADDTSNGCEKDLNPLAITKLCQDTFSEIISSENFASLCKLLLENFQGIKDESLFDFSPINSRMKEGAYENSPLLFSSDIQQVWRKLHAIGSEIVSLTKCLSDLSKTSYCEQVGGVLHGKSEGKHEESDWLNKSEKREACGVYKPSSCHHCGEQSAGKDCLVCDLCEDIYHISCIDSSVKDVSLKSWYCRNCSISGIETPHKNCIVCERLHLNNALLNGGGGDLTSTNDGETEVEESSNGLVENGIHLKRGSKKLSQCKMCGSDIENGEKYRVCGHSFCENKYYHLRCLTSMEVGSYGPCWYCPSCLCRVCLTDRDDDKIVLCDGCDHAYHIYCMEPPRSSVPRGKWFCGNCYQGIQEIRKAKRAYEISGWKMELEGEEGSKDSEEFEMKKRKGKEVLDKKADGAVELLLNAAKTLNHVEKLVSVPFES